MLSLSTGFWFGNFPLKVNTILANLIEDDYNTIIFISLTLCAHKYGQ